MDVKIQYINLREHQNVLNTCKSLCIHIVVAMITYRFGSQDNNILKTAITRRLIPK